MYGYAANNPVRYTDPDGNFTVKIPYKCIGKEGTFAHNAAYRKVLAAITLHGYEKTLANRAMRDDEGATIISSCRLDWQSATNGTIYLWEMNNIIPVQNIKKL